MGLEAVVLTVSLLPVYLALRWPFFHLPLHLDTGYYVSNHTICTRRIDFSKGWNAHFAGCSKVLPEYFYSVIYVLHGADRYKYCSRLYYSIFNYATAILVGYVCYMVAGSSQLYYYLGLVLYCMFSSEPHYGIYFENGEQFELIFQVIGFLFIYVGVVQPNEILVGVGIGVWALESFFIKTASMISTVVLAVGAASLLPTSIPYVLGFGIAAGLLYFGWIFINGRNPLRLLQALAGHEKYSARQRHSLVAHMVHMLDKWRFLYKIVRSRPIIPGMALLGFVPADQAAVFFLLYLLATSTSYVFQAAQVWYYAIPFLPVLSMLAAFAVGWLLGQGTIGTALVLLLLLTWIGHHVAESYGRLAWRGIESLGYYVWRPHGGGMVAKDVALEAAAKKMRPYVAGHRMFIFGRWNQAYLLFDTSYETPLVSAAVWLDEMQPGWWRELNEQMLRDPPQYLLDTDNCLDYDLLERRLGLRFQVIDLQPPSFRLFKLISRKPNEHYSDFDFRPYRSCP